MQKHPDWFRWVKLPGDRGQWELVEWPPTQLDMNRPVPTTADPPTLSLVQ